MSDSITIKIEYEKLQRALLELQKRLKDLSPIMQAISEKMLTGVQENFLTEGKNLGEKWEKLSQKHQDYRRKRRYTPIKILTMRGALMTSIANNHTSNSAIVGTNLKYAAIHNGGFDGNVSVPSHSRKSKKGKTYTVKSYSRHLKMPKRRFLGLSEKDIEEIIEIINDALFYVL